MNFSRTHFVALALLLGIAICLRAQTPSDSDSDLEKKISALENIVLQDAQQQAAPAQTPATPSTNGASATPPAMPTTLAPPVLTPAVRYVRSLRQDVLRQSYVNAIGAANNAAGADNSAAVQKAVADILPLLQKLEDEQDAASKQQLQGIQGVVDRATQAITSAKDPKELDPVIRELGQAINENRSGRYTPDRQATSLQLESVNRFVKEWQSYLSDESAGNTMLATNDLRNLANMSDTYMPIPRSDLLARAQKVSGTQPQVIDAKIEVQSFDDIPAAISQLQAMQRNGNYTQEMNDLMSSLQGLRNANQAYQDKNYLGALQALQNYPFMAMGNVVSGMAPASGVSSDKAAAHDSLRQEIIALKDTLILEITQGLLAMPDAPAPEKDEHASDYLLRVAALKEKAADWTGLKQVLGVYQQVAGPYNPQPWLQEDMEGIRAYLVGEKLEAAGQNLDAIRSYRQSLATLGKYFPADPPASKLKELQKSYPDLYQQALLQPIAPKTP
jgi:hypothetical protein